MDATLQSNRDTLSRLSPEERQRLWFEGIRRPESFPVREEYLKQEFMVNGLVRGEKTAIQDVPTPFALAEEMVRKLVESTGELSGKKILVYNVEFLDILYRMGIMWTNEIWFVNENPLKVQWAKDIYRGDGDDQFIVQNWLDWNTTMKFDVICGNPPYQTQKGDNKKTQPLWDKFVSKSLDLLRDGGYLCMVHPPGWRNVSGIFKNIQDLFKAKQMSYLEIHNQDDGTRVFGADIRYDWYCLRNVPSTGKPTKIKCEDGSIESLDLSTVGFIPNGMFKELQQVVAQEGEETVTVIADASYGTLKESMSKEKTTSHRYPCVYYTSKKSGISLWYSSTNKSGHFGIPKVIFTKGRIKSVDAIVDASGEYGLTQFAYGIVDDVENLDNIKKAFDSKKFRSLMEMCAIFGVHINIHAVKLLKRDFWKQFVDENGNELP